MSARSRIGRHQSGQRRRRIAYANPVRVVYIDSQRARISSQARGDIELLQIWVRSRNGWKDSPLAVERDGDCSGRLNRYCRVGAPFLIRIRLNDRVVANLVDTPARASSASERKADGLVPIRAFGTGRAQTIDNRFR